ncbi:MAG: DegV family protein [Clostridia bacterium]|nr:DegV family protein [Clostridia bacterium]
MKDFVIITDSGCDVKPELLTEWGVENIELSFRFDKDDRDYFNCDMPISDFYDRMRAGDIAKTAAINPDRFANAFEPFLQQGKDVLHLSFSSGLSVTCNSARLAAEELMSKYPDRKIVVVDTLAASAGQGLLVYLTVQKQKEGCTLEEAADYAEQMKLQICHWVTVDDLVYLKRGGRISPTVALVGKALGIKPIIHVDNAGKLVSVSKVRGRKHALATVAGKYTELAKDPAGGTVFISHGDCLEDAERVAELIQESTGAKTALITDIGPVIGAHAGPGTIALFFVGKER